MFRIGLTALDRSDQLDRGADLPGGITSSSVVQIGCSIYAFRLSRWDLRNGTVQLAFWQCYPDQYDQFIGSVWPVRPDCPANSVFANFGCQHMPPCFLVKLAYQEISHKAQNCTETMRSTCANHVLLSRTILYIGHVIWFCSISLLRFCFMSSQAWVHITSAVNSWNTNWKSFSHLYAVVDV